MSSTENIALSIIEKHKNILKTNRYRMKIKLSLLQNSNPKNILQTFKKLIFQINWKKIEKHCLTVFQGDVNATKKCFFHEIKDPYWFDVLISIDKLKFLYIPLISNHQLKRKFI